MIITIDEWNYIRENRIHAGSPKYNQLYPLEMMRITASVESTELTAIVYIM